MDAIDASKEFVELVLSRQESPPLSVGSNSAIGLLESVLVREGGTEQQAQAQANRSSSAFAFIKQRTSAFSLRSAFSFSATSPVQPIPPADASPPSTVSPNRHPIYSVPTIASVSADFDGHVMRLKSLLETQIYSDKMCICLKDVHAFVACFEIVARLDENLDVLVQSGAVATLLKLLALFPQYKCHPQDQALAQLLLTLWRDTICTSLATILRAISSASASKWLQWIQTGSLSQPASLGISLNPKSSNPAVLASAAGIDPTALFSTLIHILQAIPNELEAPGVRNLYANIAFHCVISIGCLIVDNISLQAILLTDLNALNLIATAIPHKFPFSHVSSTASTVGEIQSWDMFKDISDSYFVNFHTCYLVLYLSLVSPPGSVSLESSPKRTLSDVASLNIVEFVVRVSNFYEAASLSSNEKQSEQSTTYMRQFEKEFEFVLDLFDARTAHSQTVGQDAGNKRLSVIAAAWESSVEDAVLMVSGGTERMDGGVFDVPISLKAALGLLVGACDTKLWVLGSRTSGGHGCNEMDDLEVVTNDKDVMERVGCILRALFESTCANVDGVVLKVGVVRFLGALLEVKHIPSSSVQQGSGEVEAARLHTRRIAIFAVLDQIGAWQILLGSHFHEHSNPFVKYEAVRFMMQAAILPDTSNSGLLLALLNIVADSKAGSQRFFAIRMLSSACQFGKLVFHKTVDSLIKLDFLHSLAPLIQPPISPPSETKATTPVSVTAIQQEWIDVSKLFVAFLDLVSKGSLLGAIYLSSNDTVRTFLVDSIALVPIYDSSTPPEIISLARRCFFSVTGTLLSASDKQYRKASLQANSDTSTSISTWISYYTSRFITSPSSEITAVDSLNVNLRLLKGFRDIVKLFGSGSIERGRVRSRLVDAKVIEFCCALCSSVPGMSRVGVKAADKDSVENPSDESIPAVAPNSVLSEEECMARTYVHALMVTMASLLTGSILANRCFGQISGVKEMKFRLFEGRSTEPDCACEIWPGFLNHVFGLLVPKLMRPLLAEDKYVYYSSDVGDNLTSVTTDVVIRNLSVLESLVGLYEACDNSLRLWMLEYLEKLAAGHEMNRVLMTQAGLVGLILRKVLPHIEGMDQLERFIKLFEIVANYSISVAEAKCLFKSLRHCQNSPSTASGMPIRARSMSLTRSRSHSISSLHTPPRNSRRPSATLFDSHGPNGQRLPFYYDVLLKSILKLFQRHEPDLDMFYFSGRNSGLVLPEFEKWPVSGNGYTFSCWIKMQEYPGAAPSVAASSTNKNTAGIVLWSMRSVGGNGVELKITNRLLGFHVYKNGQESSLFVNNISLIAKRWYLINVCHAGPKLPWFNDPDVTLYINGFSRASGKMPYPDILLHAVNRIGASGVIPTLLATSPNASKRGFVGNQGISSDSIPDIGESPASATSASMSGCAQSFCGQMTSVYLMEDVLSLPQVEALYGLGPGHCTQFKAEDLPSYPEVGKTLFDGSLNTRIILQFYPTAIQQGSVSFACYDIGPRHIGEADMREVMACSSKCLQTSIHAFGGIQVLFPLLTHLNYPIEVIPSIGSGKMSVTADTGTDTPNAVRNARLVCFLQITGLLLGSDFMHMEKFAEIQGPKIMSLMLQQEIGFVNMKSLDAVMALGKIASETSMLAPNIAAPGSLLASLASDIEDSLVFDYRIWALTEASVQLEHAEFLNQYLLAKNDILRAKYGVTFLLDTLEKYYWVTPPDYLSSELTSKLLAARGDFSTLSKIRESMFNCISTLVTRGGGLRPDECHRLVLSLWTGGHDSAHVLDLLDFLIDSSLGFASNGVLETFLANSCAIEVLMNLLFRSNLEQIRVSVLKLMLVMLKSSRTPDKWKRKLRLEELPGNFNSGAVSCREIGATVASNLSQFYFSRHVYLCFLQLAIEEQLLDWHSDRVIFQLSDLPTVSISNGTYLVAILQLLADARYTSTIESQQLISSVLEDLLLIVGKSPANSEQLRKIYGWQILLLELIVVDPNVAGTSKAITERSQVLSPVAESPAIVGTPAAESLPLSEAVPELVLEIFSICLLDGFVSDRRVWRSVEESLAMIWLSKKCGGMHNGVGMIGLLLRSLMTKIRAELSSGDADMFAGNTLENVYHLVSLTEEYLFSYNDLYDELLNEVQDYEAQKISENSGSTSFFENIGSTILATKKDRQTIDVQMAYPFHDNRKLAEECVHLIASLLDFGISHVTLADTLDKAHTRPGGLPRIQLRLLLNAISTGNHEVWSTVLPHFVALFEKHSDLGGDENSKVQIGSVFSQLTDSYKASIRESNSSHDSSSLPATQAIFPLFAIAIHQWYEYLLSIWNEGDPSSLTRDFIEEIESNSQNFTAFVTSTAWSLLYDKHFFIASRLVEDEELAYAGLLKKRYAKVAKPHVQKAAKHEILTSKMKSGLESHLSVLRTRREGEFNMSVPETLVLEESDRRLTSRRWLSIYHGMTQERGIWLPKLSGGIESQGCLLATGGPKWKLDRTENHLRMHQRLIPNFEFDDHKDASNKRDRTSKLDSEKTSTDNLLDSQDATENSRKTNLEKLKTHYKSDERKLSVAHQSEEHLADDWDIVAGSDENLATAAGKPICVFDCEMILLMTAVKGRLELSDTNITFYSDLRTSAAGMNDADQKILALVAESEVLLRERRWPISKLREAYFRRCQLRNSAIEFFFVDGSNCFFNFKGSKPKLSLLSHIVRLRPPNLKIADPRNPVEMIAKSDVTERWQRHEISNFEYLMHLNTVSGRTNNDLTQYPVFPWIITDYKSEKLDLQDPRIYRDLSKPIGALDPARLQNYLQNYENFEDPSGETKKFMYGTHYSSSAAVLFYMLRVEPFASLHIALQGGKFDHSDRQFDSLESCWKSVLTGSGDVKELIPEFFYMPEFLINENSFDLGVKQTGARVNDVILPPWAASPEEFVRIHRMALEGDYVSAHLHEWIDLIWGYKQTGPESVTAHNVFHYLTYEGAVNIDHIQDPMERASIEAQINNFGQTPMQLFKLPHPSRLNKQDFYKPNIFASKQLETAFSVSARGGPVLSGSVVGSMPFISTASVASDANANRKPVAHSSSVMKSFLGQHDRDKMITIDSNMTVGVHRYICTASNSEQPFIFEADDTSIARRRLPCYLAANVSVSRNLFAHTKDMRHLFTGGHWDSSFQVVLLDAGANSAPKTVDTIYGHHDIVTCVAISEDGTALVTGSRDTTVIAWEIMLSGTDIVVKQNTRRVFYGHDDEVSCVAVHTEQDLVVSGSLDGTCIVHALGTSQYIRTIKPSALTMAIGTSSFMVSKILLSKAGIIVHSEELGSLLIDRASRTEAAAASSTPGGEESVDDLGLGDLKRSARRISGIGSGGGFKASSKCSYLEVFSVNGKLLSSRRFASVVLDDFSASKEGGEMFLTMYEQPFAVGDTSDGGLLVELVRCHDLKTVFKQRVSGWSDRRGRGGAAADRKENHTSLHISADQRCLFVGYSADQVLVFIADR
ncbi:Neurobeachin-like protein 1 [Chytriomyces hyalinus]|nr:Neurobeachin-like protein 1 [Chytriomyces hyalinus]